MKLPALRSLGELADASPVLIVDTREQEPLDSGLGYCGTKTPPGDATHSRTVSRIGAAPQAWRNPP
jgi:hypothetical protein